MPAALAPDHPPVRHGKYYTPEEIREETAEAVESSPLTHAEIAAELGVSRGAVTRAASRKEKAGRYLDLQTRILELTKGYTFDGGPLYRASRMDRAGDAP